MPDVILQASTILNELNAQATGAQPVAIVDTTSFMAVANTLLVHGVDMISGAVDNLLSRTLFSTRPYSRKLVTMHKTTEEFGIFKRRLHVADEEAEDSEVYADTSLAGVDMFRAKTPKIATTYIHGGGVHTRKLKVYDHQFNTAFSSPSELLGFMSMLQQNFTDLIEQTHEQEARATLANYMAAKYHMGGAHCIYLLDEYNAETGQTLTRVTVKHPDNFPAFIKWAYARINYVSSLLTERSELYHVKPGIDTKRHTPKDLQHLYLLNEFAVQIGTRVKGDVYHPEFLNIPTAEVVNYWQGIMEPSRIHTNARYTLDTGREAPAVAVDTDNIIGMLCDKDALGMTTIDTAMISTPVNAAGRYTVKHAHFTDRTYCDFNAQAVVFALEA